MAEPPLLQLGNASVTFGGKPLFSGIDLALSRGERVCLVGRNGSGKSTLLKLLAGLIDPDSGSRFVQPGTVVRYLPQEPDFGSAANAREHAGAGLDRHGLARLDTIFDALGVDASIGLKTLSGGEARRVDLARVLAAEPDLLLLDEPTNHLDLPSIEWLEQTLGRFSGALLMISHDRAFLSRLTNRSWWLDRGALRRRTLGFTGFEAWQDEVIQAEEQELARMGKRLQSEMLWLREGLTARRKRNEGRVRALMALRKQLSDHQGQTGKAKLEAAETTRGGSMVIEAEHISKTLGERTIVGDFSIRVARGARIGIIGRNGAGKTTLLRLLTGELTPDSGRIRHGMGIEAVYFDQNRTRLDPDQSLWRTLGEGNDQIFVGGRPKHVASYLRDYLFADEQMQAPVRSLSGGERARLTLAKLFARESNLIVLDEPTNDLDMETLDLLEDAIGDYQGTILLVSHDRDFLDRVVTTTLVFEEDGRIASYAGGYSDYLKQRPEAAPATSRAKSAQSQVQPRKSAPSTKLSYKDQREREQLPERIATLEAEIATAETKLADPSLYSSDPASFAKIAARLDEARSALAAAEERWLDLELLAEQLGQTQQ